MEETYLEYLTFSSNSGDHQSEFTMELKGTGGKDAEQGPIIDVVSSVDFGEVKIGKFDTLSIEIKSIGTAPLYLIKNDFLDRGNGSFDYNKESDSKSGFMIPPDSTYRFTVRYIPQVAGRLDSGLIKLETNQKGGGAFSYIKLYGRGAAAAPKLLMNTSSVNFDTVLTGHDKETQLVIKNTGSANLVIDSIKFIRNDSSAFSIIEGGTSGDGGETQITVLPAEEHILKIQFTPAGELLYNATVQISSNFADIPDYKIYFTGVGLQDTVGVGEEFDFAGNELFIMKAMPNPNFGKAAVDYKLKSEIPCKVEMFLVDFLGNRISTLINTTISPGDYRLEMDIPAAKLSSGTYYIIANVSDTQVRLPIVILK